jgi:lysophospholipase L1-like esterase
VKRIGNTLSILIYCLGLLLFANANSFNLFGQIPPAEPAPVPKIVAIPRPSEEEVQIAKKSLAAFFKTADPATKAINAKYSDLIAVRVPRPNTAIIPSLPPYFQTKHQANLEEARKGSIELLFMGDSITDMWRNTGGNMAGKPVFDKYFSSWKTANFGIGGDTTQGVLYRLKDGESQGFSPRAIMLMIGTNNTASNNAAEIAEGIGAIVLEMKKDFPKAKILLLGIFPRGEANDPIRIVIKEINRIIANLNDGDRVHYLDIGSRFLNADGNIPKDIMSDGLHPTTKGYEIWADAVKQPLANLLK